MAVPSRIRARQAAAGATVAVALVLLAVGATYRLMNARDFQICGHLVNQVFTSQKVAALTFDDGPGQETAKIMAILREKQVRATFFVIGSELHRRSEDGRALVAAGHELGNHTWDHRRMVFVSPATVADQVTRTDAEIRAAGHTGPIYFRPPNGKKLVALPCYLAQHDRTTITWNVEPDSGKRPTAQQLVDEVIERIQPGSIVLLHPWNAQGSETRAAIPLLIDQLHARGYELVTINDLLTTTR